jgi:membrane protease YdiL (CAAX protease family)
MGAIYGTFLAATNIRLIYMHGGMSALNPTSWILSLWALLSPCFGFQFLWRFIPPSDNWETIVAFNRALFTPFKTDTSALILFYALVGLFAAIAEETIFRGLNL